MTSSKGNQIWKDWDAVANRAKQPPDAPRRTRVTMPRSGLPAGMAAVSIVLVVVVVAAMRLYSSTSSGTGPSASPAPASASQTVSTESPGPGPLAVTFTLPGDTSSWHSFKWTKLPSDNPFSVASGLQVFSWRGGYVASGGVDVGGPIYDRVWTSPDGHTWRQVTAIDDQVLSVAVSPAGLVAIAGNSEPHQVWSSSDGSTWQKLGTANGLPAYFEVAGSTGGLVAVELGGPFQAPTTHPHVMTSADGLSWTSVTVEAGFTGADGFNQSLHSNNGRFYLEAAAGNSADTSGKGLVGVEWWSNDGHTWSRSTGGSGWVPGVDMLFGQHGILLPTTNLTGTTLQYALDGSTDGGKSWQTDSNYGPVGRTTCAQCDSLPDGQITSNGAVFLAVKNDGHQAWTSYDGKTWTAIDWNAPSSLSTFVALPGGVIIEGYYGAAQ
jgi:hypothetical protein